MGGTASFANLLLVKFPLSIAVFCAIGALLVAGCGSSASSETTVRKRLVTHTRGVRSPPSRVNIPAGPPPNHLVVKELKKGFGEAARWGERLSVHFVGINYNTRKVFELHWPRPFSFNFGIGEVRIGWERGLKGMRVGGRRELSFPARLGYGRGTPPLFYIVELLAIEKGTTPARADASR